MNACLLAKGTNMKINSEIGTYKLTVIEQNVRGQEIKRPKEGELGQEIDAASDKIDDILLRHVTPRQKDKLNNIYQQLDQLFEKNQPTAQEEKSAEALFEQVHNILESSVNKLTSAERETVDKLANKMEELSSTQGIRLPTKDNKVEVSASGIINSNNISLSTEGKLSQEIDTASDKIDDILLRHVTPAQKDKLDDIYQQLDQLFEKDPLTEQEEKSAEALFEQVHNILESSVNKLTSAERETVDQLANKMDGLITQLERSDTNRSQKNDSTSNKVIVSDDLSNILTNKKQANPKKLTVAELNALSALELNKLPANQLKKLNAQQLNKLNASQLNSLALPQLKQLSANNLSKVNQSQTNKIFSPVDLHKL